MTRLLSRFLSCDLKVPVVFLCDLKVPVVFLSRTKVVFRVHHLFPCVVKHCSVKAYGGVVG